MEGRHEHCLKIGRIPGFNGLKIDDSMTSIFPDERHASNPP